MIGASERFKRTNRGKARGIVPKLFVLAHNIRSRHNVGSIFRTCEVFGVDKVFLSGYTATPPDEKVAKVSLGAENLVPWQFFSRPATLMRLLRSEYPRILVVALENNLNHPSIPIERLDTFKTKKDILLVLGEEVSGVGKGLLSVCDTALEIPQLGQKESLNVSVALGIALYGLKFG